jgi:hypothetical protein
MVGHGSDWERATIMAQLQLLRLLCINPATAAGDDIKIVVDGQDAGGEFGIDKGQTHDLTEFVFDVDEDTANIVFFEDNDHAADFDIDVTKAGKARKDVAIKEGGFYLLAWRVIV